jgi:hypothetical protein
MLSSLFSFFSPFEEIDLLMGSRLEAKGEKVFLPSFRGSALLGRGREAQPVRLLKRNQRDETLSPELNQFDLGKLFANLALNNISRNLITFAAR